MANGERCIRCDFQETSHDLGEALRSIGRGKKKREIKCTKFVSEYAHKKDCPVIGCYGDCDAMIAGDKAATDKMFRDML